jgi:RNA recognition motif-containing protein
MSSVVNEADLLQMFGPFGDIIVARIQRGTKQKGLKMCVHCCAAASSPCLSSHAYNHRRFIGFVDFYSVDSAVAAVRALQGVSLCGRPMRLEFSQVHAQPACNHKHPAPIR